MNDEAIAEFAQALRDPLIGRDHPEYEGARKLYNAMIDKKPLLIARCADVGDVIAAVNFGRESKLPIAVRGGGHNVPGFGSVDDGLVIDLSTMKRVRVDPKKRTVRVGRDAPRRRRSRHPGLRPGRAVRNPPDGLNSPPACTQESEHADLHGSPRLAWHDVGGCRGGAPKGPGNPGKVRGEDIWPTGSTRSAIPASALSMHRTPPRPNVSIARRTARSPTRSSPSILPRLRRSSAASATLAQPQPPPRRRWILGCGPSCSPTSSARPR